MDRMSRTLQSIDILCRQYDNVISRLHSYEEEDEEERWQVRDATKGIISELEKQAAPMVKEALWMVRLLNTRVQSLLEKSNKVFPQMDELASLKSIQSEINTILSKAAPKSLSSCPFCRRFGGYKLVEPARDTNDNVFVYVAEKIASSGGGAVNETDPEAMERPIEKRHCGRSWKMRGSKSENDLNRTGSEEEPDTETIHSPTVQSDPLYREDEGEKEDLMWKDYEDTDDAPDNSIIQRPQRREFIMWPGRRERRWKRKIRRFGSSTKRKCITCLVHKSVDAGGRNDGPVNDMMDPKLPVPKKEPISLPIPDLPTDWIGSTEDITSGEQRDLTTESDTAFEFRVGKCRLVILLLTALLLNVVVLNVRFLAYSYGLLEPKVLRVSTCSLWIPYCAVANTLCRSGYEFACTEYCASRLDLYLWGW